MQSQNPFLDELAKMTTSAMSLAQAAGEEAKTAFRSQADRFVADMDLVRRDELEALKAEIADLKAQVAALLKERSVSATETSIKPKGKGVKPDVDLPVD
ncbi:hypothetical protein ABAC460_16690 [Asticcacaulis sp. AC460]|uniref:accessory factor UbiK family protein n=1 Tax=Asticcacaulis sp. AC460 TaxID=1282360 RepID=UPI0003C3DF22|nr:accessory factor UbiK family protein [Asticcacaulis sp. AC460]ESQ88297.1 hypothetical protein ABAC460_16690 [Asticcacaulis sp. AC460]